MKNKQLLAGIITLLLANTTTAQSTNKTNTAKMQQQPLKSSYADSMRRVSMGQDSTHTLMYNEQGKPIDTTGLPNTDKDQRIKRNNRTGDPQSR